MADQRVERVGGEDRLHDIEPAHGEADGLTHTLIFQLKQRVYRTVFTGNFVQITRVFRVVQVQQRDVADAQPLQTFLQ